MDALQTLIEIEAIRNLKAKYFRTMDTKDWDGFKSVWSPEIDHEMPAEGQQYSGPSAAFVDFVAKALEGVVTVHHGQTAEIEITSPITAKAIWAFVDRLKPSADAYSDAPEMIGYGHYHEGYEKSPDGGWRIRTQVVTRLRIDHPGGPGFSHLD